jgi:16S rRNA (cytosine967-C5)-methyltransferase
MNQRKKANQILNQIIVNGKFANLLMRNELNGVNKEDASFITNIVNGVMRNNRYLNYQYSKLLTKCAVKDQIILNMAVYELMFLKNESYGVVNDYVDISHNKKFINGILRNYLRNEVEELDLTVLENIGIRYSINDWIIKLWNAHYGFDETLKIAEITNKIPKMTYRLNNLKSSFEELEKYDINIINGLAFECETNLLKTDEFREGKLLVQDYSSQLVINYLDLEDNLTVLDVCAAPGTKTTQIAQLMNNSGKIVANDIYQHRVELIKNLADKLGVTNIECINQDATTIELSSTFDRILVDAPCSGLGVLRKKPDIKFHLTMTDIDEIITIQENILDNVCKYLIKDGILVYSTCTLNKKENQKQVIKFLKKHEEFQLLEEKTVLPYEFASDGFYMAKLKKVK